jgi:arsenate reductase
MSESSMLILCTGNSCRSQMAEAWLRSFDPSLRVFSAGTSPATSVHPKAILVMQELGMDLSQAFPKNVDEFLEQSFDYVITVCDHAKETCPVFIGKVNHRMHMGFDDPGNVDGTDEVILREFRRVRDEIGAGFRAFYETQLAGNTK